jgi:hypothetical protein
VRHTQDAAVGAATVADDARSALPADLMGLAAVDRDSVPGDPVERRHVVGYPAFMERDARDGGRFRETADAFGLVPVLSGLAKGLLSEWSGMSGGPVVADGLLLGVVTEHAPRVGPSEIMATPLTALEADPAHPWLGAGGCGSRRVVGAAGPIRRAGAAALAGSAAAGGARLLGHGTRNSSAH